MKALACLLFTSLLAAPVLAQDIDAISDTFGVSTVDGRVAGGGPGYAVRFDRGGIEFVPALGRRAERPLPVRYTLADVRRDGAVSWSADPTAAEPQVDGATVRYARGAGLTEVYAVGRAGVEQSFVFAARPAGQGDLVVRGTIATELPLVAASDAGLRYEREGLGGVTFGAVTGIDASGATVRGAIRVDGEHVEWVLPGDFVDHAAYPLVLDPLVGAAFAVGDAAGVDQRPAVAFDVSNNRYLVVWTVVVSASQCELRGQFVAGSGTVVGSMLTLAGFAHPDVAPQVANVNAVDRFVVVWRSSGSQATSVTCTVVNPSNGAVTGSASINATQSNVDHRLALGGDERSVGDKCLVAVTPPNGGTLVAVTVQVLAAGAPIVGLPLVLSSGPVGEVSISHTAGAAGRWMVAWTKGGSGSGPFPDVVAATVSEAGTLCSPVVDLQVGSVGGDVSGLRCATADGTRFVAAWQDNVAGQVQGRVAVQGSLCPGTLLPGATIDPITSTNVQTRPSIDFARDKYLLSWTEDLPGTGQRTFAKGLDPDTCAACGLPFALEPGITPQDQSCVATRWSGGDGASDQGLAVWSNGTIRGRRIEAVGSGTVIGMGGACGSTGFDDFNTYSDTPVLGDLDFELILANPTTPAVALVVGLSEVSIPCGPCTLVPAIDATVGGSTTVPLPIPCDLSWLGLTFTTQWLILKPGGCPAFPDLALSNALRFTVGE